MEPIRWPYVLSFRLLVRQDPPTQPSRMNLTIRLLIATALLLTSGCAKSDWIDRTLVTVDVTGVWEGKQTVNGPILNRDIVLVLQQQGAKVTGEIRNLGTGGFVGGSTPIQGTVNGDMLSLSGRGISVVLQVNGDEMTGSGDLINYGSRWIFVGARSKRPAMARPTGLGLR